MANKLMYIPNNDINKINPSIDYNYWLKHLDTQLNVPTNQSSIKVLKLLSQPIRKYIYKTLGTSVINSLMSSPSLGFMGVPQSYK